MIEERVSKALASSVEIQSEEQREKNIGEKRNRASGTVRQQQRSNNLPSASQKEKRSVVQHSIKT